MISFKLSVVPIKKPANPTKAIRQFLNIMNAFDSPDFLFQLTIVSNIAGISIPSVDNVKAPINEINNSKFGITTAIITTQTKIE